MLGLSAKWSEERKVLKLFWSILHGLPNTETDAARGGNEHSTLHEGAVYRSTCRKACIHHTCLSFSPLEHWDHGTRHRAQRATAMSGVRIAKERLAGPRIEHPTLIATTFHHALTMLAA
jgi:hypothetical protein